MNGIERLETLGGLALPLLELVATAAFALSGVLEAVRKRMDAVGLGLFCASAVHLANSLGSPPLVAIMMGVVTGIFGGVLRDMVCNEIPTTLRDHRPYALCAFAGGIVYVALDVLSTEAWLSITACALTTFGLRALAIRFGWSLPAWRPD